MANGKDFDNALADAVVDPVLIVATENLANLGTVEFRECLAAKLRVVGELLYRLQYLVFKPSSKFKEEVVFKILSVGGDTALSALCDEDLHTAARILLVFDFALRSSRSRRARISFSKSSIDTTSPRSASPSATRRSS